MNTYYCADDFNGLATADTLADILEKKIGLLYDFCIIKTQSEEYFMRTHLSTCKTENAMSIMIHDLLVGRETLQQFMRRKVYA